MDTSTVVGSQEPWIDHLSYPHIVEAILNQSSWTTLARWRQTSKKYCDRAEAIMFAHIVVSTEREEVADVSSANDMVLDDDMAVQIHIRAPRGRPLPSFCWDQRGLDPHDARFSSARRMLKHTRVVDWDIYHNTLDLYGRSEDPDAIAQALSGPRPLTTFLTDVQVVRRHDASPCNIAADTYIDFVHMTSRTGRALSKWNDSAPPAVHITTTPHGTRRHIIHVLYDPQHVNLDHARWSMCSTLSCAMSDSVLETSIVFSKVKGIRCPIRRIPPVRSGHPLGFAGVLVHSVTSVLWRGGTLSIVGVDDIPATALFGPPFVHFDAPFFKADKRIMISRFVFDLLKDLAWTPDRFETAFNNIKLYTHEQYATSAGPDHHLVQHPPMFHRVSLDTRTGRWTDDMKLPEELVEDYQDSDTEYTLDDDPSDDEAPI